MDPQEYTSEWGGWRRTAAGPRGVDYHQWDNISEESTEVQQTPRDMSSVPRSYISPKYITLPPPYRDPVGYKQDGPPAPVNAFDDTDIPGINTPGEEAISNEERPKQSNYILGPSSASNAGRLMGSRSESSYLKRNGATPGEATLAGSGSTYTDGYGKFTLPLFEEAQGDVPRWQTKAAGSLPNPFGHPENDDNATDPDRDAGWKLDPKLPSSGYQQGSYECLDNPDKCRKSDADFRRGFDKKTE